ncbi:MAG: hypothetical protein OXL97_10375 [Chloroflexota bacterium]|nr:hypothetical protein [Chloroflexota bacterium]MDE2886188.1 hypothetical protein [Chloroflexota bacterium]
MTTRLGSGTRRAAGAAFEVGVDGRDGEYGDGNLPGSLDEIEGVRRGLAPIDSVVPAAGEFLGDGIESGLRTEAGEVAFEGLEPGGHRAPRWPFSMLKA